MTTESSLLWIFMAWTIRELLSDYSRSPAHPEAAPAITCIYHSWEVAGTPSDYLGTSSDYAQCSSESRKRQLQCPAFSSSSLCTVRFLLRPAFPVLTLDKWYKLYPKTHSWVLILSYSTLKSVITIWSKSFPFILSNRLFFFLILTLNLQCFSWKPTLWE